MQMRDTNDPTKMIDVPVNQHTGPHWLLLNERPRETDNSIYVQWGREAAINPHGNIAQDAFIMSAKMKNGKVVIKKPRGVYDIGVIRCRLTNDQYLHLGLKNLELPNV